MPVVSNALHSVFPSLPLLPVGLGGRVAKQKWGFYPLYFAHSTSVLDGLLCQEKLVPRNRLPNSIFFSVVRGKEDWSLQSSAENKFVF